jgi:transcriptional regulator with XRE-family HTH domain
MKNMEQLLLFAIEEGKRQHGSASGLSRASGVSPANISRWASGKQSPRISEYSAILEAVHAQIVYPDKDLVEYELIPKTTARAGAGSSFLTEDEPDGLYAFRKDFLANLRISKNAVLLDVMGDSMEPTLRHGDTILVDKSDIEVHDGQIYLIGFQEQLLVKRLFRDVGGIVLKSDNQAYRETLVPPEYADDFVVFGRMRWMARTF